MATWLYSQEVDMSQVSLNLSDRTKPYLGKEVVDTIGTCKAVRAELEAILSEGINAFNSSDNYGHHNFIHNYQSEIEVEQDKLLVQYEAEIKTRAVAEAEKEYHSILLEARNMKQDDIRRYYTPQYMGSVYEPTTELCRLIPSVLVKLNQKYCYNIHVRVDGIPKLEKLSKALQKELPKNKGKIIEELIPTIEEKLMTYKRDELRTQAENYILRNHIKKILDRMPSVDSPECFDFIHSRGHTTEETDNSIPYLSDKYFRERGVFKTNKKKVITWKNPNYFKEDDSWDWLLEKEENVPWRESVEKHFPVEDTYIVDSRHPDFQIRRMYVKTQHGCEVNAAFTGDILKGVSNDFSYRQGSVDTEMEHVLCFYELEHNQYDINAQPAYTKDAIRYALVRFHESDTGGSYSYDFSFNYKKNHKSETMELADQYIKQLHLDHQIKLGSGKNQSIGIDGFKHRRTKRIDGTTFRHYIGDDEQIVILQKYVYGNYCTKLFPFSKVTTFNSQDYIINKDVFKPENKVLTCYYIVEKYE